MSEFARTLVTALNLCGRLSSENKKLREALEALLEATPQECCGVDCDETNCPWEQARAALQQATGKES